LREEGEKGQKSHEKQKSVTNNKGVHEIEWNKMRDDEGRRLGMPAGPPLK